MFAKLRMQYHKLRMSELGQELAEALCIDTWVTQQHKMRHQTSGITLWTSNGFRHFSLYEIPSTPGIGEAALKTALNYHDKVVLWELVKVFKAHAKAQPAQTILNPLRLARQHKEN